MVVSVPFSLFLVCHLFFSSFALVLETYKCILTAHCCFPGYEYDNFSVQLVAETTLIDFLQWITSDIELPKWASLFLSTNKYHLPYPWNVVVVANKHPEIQIAATKVLRVLVASIHSLADVVSTSLETDIKMTEKWREKNGNRKHIKDRMGLGHPTETTTEEDCNEGDDEMDNDEEDDTEEVGFGHSDHDEGNSSKEESESESESEDDGIRGAVDMDEISDDSFSEESENSDEDLDTWEKYKAVTVRSVQLKLLDELNAVKQTRIISQILGRIDKKRKNGRSVRKLSLTLQKGVTKNWHLRLIQKAVAANRFGLSMFGSANLIGSLRKLAAREYQKNIMLLKAREDLRNDVFGTVIQTKVEHSMTVVAVEELGMSHLTVTTHSVATNRWKALKHFVRLNQSSETLTGDTNYTERIYYTVSTRANRHNLLPLWELLPPEELMTAMGASSTYTIEFEDGNLGLVFSSTKACGNNHGVSIASIKPGSQADLGKHGNITVDDQLNRVNGVLVRGPAWNKRKVIEYIKKEPRPLLLSFSGKEVKRFVAQLYETAPTKRWTPGCEDSVWEEPADSIFRIVRVVVNNRSQVKEDDIRKGKVLPMDGGSGLLRDSVSDVVDAYIVETSPIIEQTVYNKGSLQYNKQRLKERFIQLAKKRTAYQIILETFASGFGVSRKKVDGDRGLLWITDDKQSRLGLIHNNIGLHKSPLVSYYSALTILELLITAHTKSSSNAATVSLLDLFRGDTSGLLTSGDVLLTLCQPGLTTLNPDTRGHVSAMYTSAVVLNVAKLIKRMNVALAKRTVVLLVPLVTYILDRFQQFDDLTKKNALLAVAQMSYRPDPTCAQILWEGTCYHAIVKAQRLVNTRAIKLVLISTLVAGCVHLPLKEGMRNELQLISVLRNIKAEMKYLEIEDSEEIALIKIQTILGKGNICEVPYYMSPKELARSSFGLLVQNIVTVAETATNAVDRWKALGALANFTKATNACQLIVKKHESVLVDITRYAQNHDMQFGIFGATLGQLEAVQIMANMSMCPGSMLLWCQFSEGHKLAMDYTGNMSPAIPIEDTLAPSARSRCSRCQKLYQDVQRPQAVCRVPKWYRLGQTWYCGHCYATKVPGRRPAWIYREEEDTLANWNKGRKQAYLERKIHDKEGMENNGGGSGRYQSSSSRKRTNSAYHPAYLPGTLVRIRSNRKYGGNEGTIVRDLSLEAPFAETEEQQYVVQLNGSKQKIKIVAKDLIYLVGPPIPPLRWGAKFGHRSMIFVSRKGMPLPSHGWSISVWFRSGSWIRQLSSNGRFLTLCESSTGDKIIALDHEMRLGSFEAANDHNEGNAWHSTDLKLHRELGVVVFFGGNCEHRTHTNWVVFFFSSLRFSLSIQNSRHT